jgi:hypothetical protein
MFMRENPDVQPSQLLGLSIPDARRRVFFASIASPWKRCSAQTDREHFIFMVYPS